MSADEKNLVPAATQPAEVGIFSRRYLGVSVGMLTMILLAAFEALAVTTIMPAVSAELHGGTLYALVFAAPLATGIIGMVAAGTWSDRHGPRAVLLTCIALFIAGLAIVGTASTMEVLVLGRVVQGLGGGGLTVALYVIVARVYPGPLHARIFAAFSAAWVVPSLIGPLIAGLVAQHFGWRWVFLGVIVLVLIAVGMLVPAMRSLASETARDAPPFDLARIGWAVLAAAAVLAVNLSADLDGPVRWVAPVVAVAVAFVALRPLVPTGTLRATRGLPSVILVRGLIAGSFFGAEVYVPYVLTRNYHFEPSGAGLALTGAGISWAVASWLQSRLATRLSGAHSIQIGALVLTAAIATALAASAFALPSAVIIAGWVLAGGGMGFMYPRTSVMTLAMSNRASQGFNSSALAIADSLGASIALVATAIVFAALLPLGGGWPFAGCFALTAMFGVLALGFGHRIGPARAAAASAPR